MSPFKLTNLILFTVLFAACQEKTIDSWQATKQSGDYRLIEDYLLNNPDGRDIPKTDLKKVIDNELKNRVQFFRFKKFTERYPFSKY